MQSISAQTQKVASVLIKPAEQIQVGILQPLPRVEQHRPPGKDPAMPVPRLGNQNWEISIIWMQ